MGRLQLEPRGSGPAAAATACSFGAASACAVARSVPSALPIPCSPCLHSTIPAPALFWPAAKHDLLPYLSLLATDGKLVLVGLPPESLEVPAFALTSREWLAVGRQGGVE